MTIEQIESMLLWCLFINAGLLIFWFVLYLVAGDLIHRVHGRWFPMSRETFGVIMYCGIGLYKLAVTLFVLVPLLVLWIVM